MPSTSVSYINEYFESDRLADNINDALMLLEGAFADYTAEMDRLDLKDFFEGTDSSDKKEEKKGGILHAIGSAVIAILSSLADFIRNITGKIGGSSKELKEDQDKLNKILDDNPYLRDQVVEGLKEEWFTVKDVVQYEKDISGLIHMLNENKISHQAFLDKLGEKTEKFNRSGTSILSAGKTLAAIIALPLIIVSSCKEAKQACQSLHKAISDFKAKAAKNYVEKEQGIMKSVINALGNAVGLTTKECEFRVKAEERTEGIIHKLANSKLGKFMKVDDESSETRRDKMHHDEAMHKFRQRDARNAAWKKNRDVYRNAKTLHEDELTI